MFQRLLAYKAAVDDIPLMVGLGETTLVEGIGEVHLTPFVMQITDDSEMTDLWADNPARDVTPEEEPDPENGHSCNCE